MARWFFVSLVTGLGVAGCGGRLADNAPDGAPPPPIADAAAGDTGFAGGCPSGACVMATALNNPAFLTTDETTVYWTETGSYNNNGAVMSCPVLGCPPSGPTVYAAGLPSPMGIAVDETNVYFCNGTAIQSCSLAGCGGSPTTLASATGCIGTVDLDPTYVYWTESDPNAPFDSSVHRIQKTGSGGDQLLTTSPPQPTFDDGTLETPSASLVDGASLYICDETGTLFRMPTTGGNLVVVQLGLPGPYGLPEESCAQLAADESHIYYSSAGGTLVSVDKATATQVVTVVSGAGAILGVAFDSATNTVDWLDMGSGEGMDGYLAEVAPDGTDQVTLASPETGQLAQVAVSGRHIFWLSTGAYLGGTPDDCDDLEPKTGALMRLDR